MKKYFLFSLILIFISTPLTVESGFSFKKAWGKVASVPQWFGGKIGDVSGIGGVVESSFLPAINKLEEANRRSIVLLDEKLKERLDQFNNILEARTSQIDEMFKTSIYLMDESLKENINKLDESLKNRIGQLNSGLTNVSYTLSSSFWTVFRGIAVLVLFLLVIYLTIDFITKYRSNSKNNLVNENNELKLKLCIKIAVILVGFVLIWLFQPSIFRKFKDPALAEEITAIEEKLKVNAETLNYNECIYYAYLLTNYEIANPKYQYYLEKYIILRDFIYRPKLSLFSLNNLQELQGRMRSLEKAKEKIEEIDKKFTDYDFDIINALFFSNALNDKEGDLIAATLANRAMATSNTSTLKILAADLISNYSFHPFDEITARNILITDSIIEMNEKVPQFENLKQTECNAMSGSILCNNYAYNSATKQLHQKDEEDFMKFINVAATEANKKEIGFRMLRRWVEYLQQLNNLSKISANILTKAISVNDQYVNYVIEYFSVSNIRIDTLISPVKNYIDEILPANVGGSIVLTKYDETRQEFDNLNIFRRYILSKFLSQFQFLTRMPFLKKELDKIKNQSGYLANFVTSYSLYQSQKPERLTKPAIENFQVYANWARHLATYNFYDREKRKPFALIIYEEMQTDIPDVKDVLRKQYESLKIEIYQKLNVKSQIFI